jgi:hypothetical protein
MGTLITDWSAPQIEIVSLQRGTTPVHDDPPYAGQGGSTLIIPRSNSVRAGHLLIAIVSAMASINPPPGWTRMGIANPVGQVAIDTKIASDSEPLSYTWTISPSNYGRTGCLIAIKAGRLEAFSIQSLSKTCPTLANPRYGAIFVAMHGGLLGNGIAVAQPPLSRQTKHQAVGSVIYSLGVESHIAVWQNVPEGTISGLNFVDDSVSDAGRATASALIIPGN